MSISLNEIESLAKKAVRGAGYSWSLADEAGRAIRSLCQMSVDGAAMLDALLARDFGADPTAHTPHWTGAEWAADKALCPLICGVLLSDRAAQLMASPFSFRAVAMPIILVPFAANIALRKAVHVTIEADGAQAVTDGQSLAVRRSLPDRARVVTVYQGGSMQDALKPAHRGHPDPDAWEQLTKLAHRTYAPSTDASRATGAGAGLTDND